MVDQYEYKIRKLLENLERLSPRRWENEYITAEFIKGYLSNYNFDVYVQEYKVVYPIYKEWYLYVDGELIKSLPCGLESGYLDNAVILDGVEVLEKGFNVDYPAIQYNRFCSDISSPIHTLSPCLSVSREDIEKIKKAKEVDGYLKVKYKVLKQQNILVGNSENPEKIVFTHYDSVWGGTVDNGLSVAILLGIIDKIDLSKVLIVFSGTEELSMNWPIYWGYGYRMFEEKFIDIMHNAKEIIVIDCIGHTELVVTKDKFLIEEAFPIESKDILNKTKLLTGDFYELMKFYHSFSDNIEKVKYIEYKKVLEEISV